MHTEDIDPHLAFVAAAPLTIPVQSSPLLDASATPCEQQETSTLLCLPSDTPSPFLVLIPTELNTTTALHPHPANSHATVSSPAQASAVSPEQFVIPVPSHVHSVPVLPEANRTLATQPLAASTPDHVVTVIDGNGDVPPLLEHDCSRPMSTPTVPVIPYAACGAAVNVDEEAVLTHSSALMPPSVNSDDVPVLQHSFTGEYPPADTLEPNVHDVGVPTSPHHPAPGTNQADAGMATALNIGMAKIDSDSSSDMGLTVPRYGRCTSRRQTTPQHDIPLRISSPDVHAPVTRVTPVERPNKRDYVHCFGFSDKVTKRRKSKKSGTATVAATASHNTPPVSPLPPFDLCGDSEHAKQYMDFVKLPPTIGLRMKNRHNARGIYAAIPECGVHRGKMFSGMFHEQNVAHTHTRRTVRRGWTTFSEWN